MRGLGIEAGGSLANLRALLPLFRELSHLKRIRSAGRDGSIAQRLFLAAWSRLIQGEQLEKVMLSTCGAALTAVRLGDLDEALLQELGLSEAERLVVLQRSFDEAASAIAPAIAERLRGALSGGITATSSPPGFAIALAEQPRAGVTCPGKSRIMLQPSENHAEHCLMVAVFGVLASPIWEADANQVFLAGLSHHLHNAIMPDSGYTGEMLLSDLLATCIERARESALQSMPAALSADVRHALAPIALDATAEAQTFHTADVLDRVLEIEQHLTHSSFTMTEVLGPYALVHEGPVKPFHDQVLAAAGLL